MIYHLRRKFIKICTISFLIVFIFMCTALIGANSMRQNKFADTLADMISENGGRFPIPDKNHFEKKESNIFMGPINEETPFSTRFFIVTVNEGNPERVNMDYVSSISQKEALEYADKALGNSGDRGWISDYRYKKYISDRGENEIVFVNAATLRSMTASSILTISLVFLLSSLMVLILIIAISKRAVKPAAESYEKQKEFITNVNHELKTPLTLILTNTDIAESEVGQNEWLDDIRSEGQRMIELVNRLVTLTKMDERADLGEMSEFNLSEAVEDTASEFKNLAEKNGKNLEYKIDKNIMLFGWESKIRQMVSILLDNGVKYCDSGGDISLSLTEKHRIILKVENSYSLVDNLDLDRLFERFYRADPARTSGSGFGIGLSIAKSIADRHRAEIRVYNVRHDRICFQVSFKKH